MQLNMSTSLRCTTKVGLFPAPDGPCDLMEGQREVMGCVWGVVTGLAVTGDVVSVSASASNHQGAGIGVHLQKQHQQQQQQQK